MRQFFKLLLASCLGTLIALVCVFFFFTGALSALAKQASDTKAISANSVLKIKLDQSLPELTDNTADAPINLNPTAAGILGLHDIARAIRRAADDSDIKGILLEVDAVQGGFATAGLLREELAAFKKKGKFIVAHASYYSQGAYYIASIADSIYLSPQGLVDLRGFSAETPFFKRMFDKLGIDMQVYYAGEFKSATEMYRRTSMSPENRLQTRALLDAMYGQLLRQVSASRGLSAEALRKSVDTYAGRTAEGALASGLIDGISYREDVLAQLRERLGLAKDKDIPHISLDAYYSARLAQEAPKGGDEVAVIIAEGTIVDGKGEAGSIGDETYVRLIEDIRKDEKVKAVVLRVNSPGGSASASDHIWEALMRLKATGKPLVVSMGDYAASGGYYIAAPADSIFAQEGAITGSIGVFMVFPSVQKLLNDKLGITFDTVQTGRYSASLSALHQLSADESRMLQERTDWLYQVFLKKVSEGRKMTIAQVDSVARGRVWIAEQALSKGLVDRVGGLDAAVESAAGMAELAEYTTTFYPEPTSPWTRLLEEWLEPDDEHIANRMLSRQLGKEYAYYRFLRDIGSVQGAQMRLPFIINFQ